MKKTGKILCLIFTFLTCVIFSACKVNYENLKISFYSADGESVQSVRLLIDSTNAYNSLDVCDIVVGFEGISEEEIGEVLVYSEPNNLVNVKQNGFNGNNLFVTLTANKQGSGSLYARHMASGKTSKIDLVVDKKTTSLTTQIDSYAIAIEPNKQINFDQSMFISQDGTDQIAFALVDGGLPTGVSAITTQFAENGAKYITGLTLGQGVLHGASFKIYPVSYMDGTDSGVQKYEQQQITITFVDALDEESFVLDTDTAHKINGLLDFSKPFQLIAKDNSQAVGYNYQYNNINFDLCYQTGNDIVSLFGEDSNKYLTNYYEPSWNVPSNFANIIEVFYNQNNQLTIEAKDYSNQIAEIEICLTPKVAGDLQVVSKIVKIQCNIKPSEYEITVQGVEQQPVSINNYNIDLYDYYRGADSAYGASFCFNPMPEYSYADLKNIKIIVNPAILDTGVNEIKGLDANTTTATNKYLLQFYLDGKPLVFEQKDDIIVSEGVLYEQDLKKLHIKYTEISGKLDSEILSITIQNYYSGELEYLKNISLTSATIVFNRKDGIKEIFVNAGEYTADAGGVNETVGNINQEGQYVTDLYLNRLDVKNYVIYLSQVLGDKNKQIGSVDMTVKVVAQDGANLNNPLQIAQHIDQGFDDPCSSFEYSYDSTKGNVLNTIKLEVNSLTDVGFYQIQFEYANEVVYTVNCFVYEELKSENISGQFEPNNNLINNKDTDGGYVYSGYEADYIIKADKNNGITLTVNLPEQYTSDYVTGYDFEFLLNGDDQQIANYLTENKSENNKTAIFYFKKGTANNTDGINYYLTLFVKVKVKTYDNIITVGSVAEVDGFVLTFFVYEEIEQGDVSLNKTMIKGYWKSLLGEYYQNDETCPSSADLQVEFATGKEYLWNYVQPQQNNKSFISANNLEKLSQTAIFDSDITYYSSTGEEITVNEESFEELKDTLYIRVTATDVVWYSNLKEDDLPITATKQTQNGIQFYFSGNKGEANFYIYAQIKQFDQPEIVLRCQIEIQEPIVTTSLYITSETKQMVGAYTKKVINLRAGQTYEMGVEFYSSQFEGLSSSKRKVTNPEFIMVVVDSFGNIHDSVVTVDGNKLKVAENFGAISGLSVIVFAKDALKTKLDICYSGYNTPEDMLMANHKKAYIKIDLILSNGTEANPYSVFDQNDFWQIKNGTNKYYRIMNNIYLTGTETISEFSGGIDTYNDTIYTIYGLKLDDSTKNLITTLSGSIKNVKFDVEYDYKEATGNLGVIGKNDGKLINTSANVSGSATLKGVSGNYINFGGLVGKNTAKISYNSNSDITTNVNIEISAEYGYFGGLVGLNEGSIQGVTGNTSQDSKNQTIEISTYVANQGTIVQTNITASGFSSGAIGGLVGLNKGSVSNVYLSGEIKNLEGKTLNNVGGVIGKNYHNDNKVNVSQESSNVSRVEFNKPTTEDEEDLQKLTNIKSSVQIQATDNVGGITGVDINGLYSNVKYQVLASYEYAIKANCNVGGIIGNADNSLLKYCSVYSYRWTDLSDLSLITADISANAVVSGLIGLANSTDSSISTDCQIVAIKNSGVNAYVSADEGDAFAFIGQRNASGTNALIDCYFVGNEITGYKGNGNAEAEDVNSNYLHINGVQDSGLTQFAEDRSGWAKNDNLNGGYLYLLAEGETEKPIFEVAPTSIELTLKTFDEGGKYANGIEKLADGVINIKLYDFDLHQEQEDYSTYYLAQTKANSYDVTEIFEISAEPSNLLSEVRLSLTSSDPSVVKVEDNNIIVCAEGQTKLTFESLMNPSVKATYTINVGKPLGDSFSLYIVRDKQYIVGGENDETSSETDYTLKLTKGEAVLLTYSASGVYKLDHNDDISYITNQQTCLKIEVEVVGDLKTNTTVKDYLTIAGVYQDGCWYLDYSTPFSIKATQKIENVTFKFTVTPYVKVSVGNYTISVDKSIQFNVQTISGVSNIALSCEKLILYPNDTTIITAYLTTDKALKKTEVEKLRSTIIVNSFVNKDDRDEEFIDWLTVSRVGDLNEEKNLQVVEFKFTIPSSYKESLLSNQTNTIIINFKAENEIGSGASNSVQLSLLKQRIDELIVRNYVYETNADGSYNYNSYTQKNTLRPVNEGLIIIDVSPINGNYDYIEISDITGSEEIVFVQTKDVHGLRVTQNVQQSTDGKGIRLQRLGHDKLYIATMIDANYTNKKHTVQVSAYVDDTVIKTTKLEIDVKMLPEANIYLLKSTGVVDYTTVGTQYVAKNREVEFKVETKNTDEGFEPTITAKVEDTVLTVVDKGNGFYSVDLGNYAGKKLTISANAQLTLNNGNVEETTSTKEFIIANYVINNVSVSHSTTDIVNGDKVTKIYGNLNSNIELEFSFDSTDLVFEAKKDVYNKGTYADQKDKPTSEGKINSILNTLNSEDVLNYLTFDISNIIPQNGETFKVEKDTEVIKTENGKSETVASIKWEDNQIILNMTQDLDINLVLTLPLKLDGNDFVIATGEDTVIKTLKCVYQLDLIEASSFIEPIAVIDETDFIQISSGDYILAQDLTLDNYSPIQGVFSSFDGNGHTITIKSFASFEEENILAGLFKSVNENSLISNLTVKYEIGNENSKYYYDLCNNSANVNYQSANFGGITASNQGIITNCNVTGYLVVRASSVEQNVSSDQVLFNIAGLVATNEETGRITNCTSKLQMIAKANLAGVVYQNDGKIVSTGFDATKENGKIYAYNNSVDVPYSILVAGFVVENGSSGEISMSYVESGVTGSIGNISAKDYSSGFVYNNSGMIYDSYADIESIGESSHNHITGFVFSNNGSVDNCYSYINNGKKTNLIDMFAKEQSIGITNCYEIKQDVIGYQNNVKGLTTVSVLNKSNENSYPTFVFGNNSDAVWTKTQIGLPKLVSVQERVVPTKTNKSEATTNGYYKEYYGLKTLVLDVSEVRDENGTVIDYQYKYKTQANNYGEKQNPILIYSLETWNYYFGQTDQTNSYYQNTKYYYRLVNDIDFSNVYDNPSSSKTVFNGNLQGNNMDLSGFKIFTSENLDNIGLFASMVSLNNTSMQNSVRNLDILPNKITASRTKTVGALAGLVQNFNLYNIDVELNDQTIVGGNIVGGVVGLVRGKFDIDGITSNVGVYASRSQQDNRYSIFDSSYNNYTFQSDNTTSVYYAGCAFGVLDAYHQDQSLSINWQTETSYQIVNHVSVTGANVIYGDTVGGAIGLVGKNVKLKNATVNFADTKFQGYQYSAGLVGENRGVITTSSVNIAGENMFEYSTYVSSGVVGFNLNGVVDNVSVYAEITKTSQTIVAGVVGRNLNGCVQNVSVDGIFNGYYVGGAIGADYDIDLFVSKSTVGGGGALRISEQKLTSMASTNYNIQKLSNLTISSDCINNWMQNLSSYYYFKLDNDSKVKIQYQRVLGLAVGLTFEENVIGITEVTKEDNSKTFEGDTTKLIFGCEYQNGNLIINKDSTLAYKNIDGKNLDITLITGETQKYTEDDNVSVNTISGYKFPEDCSGPLFFYMVGAKVTIFDYWMSSTGYTFKSGNEFAFVN